MKIYRKWPHSDHPTYRYIGANLYHGIKWYQVRIGWRVDYLGRVYYYLGKLILWQDVVPSSRRPVGKFSSRWIGPIEVCIP
ncbi:hypothetical protein LCGC14_1962580 [marine sediment metagenome]|uniref:Uncharacterized protein n=1 Tax=marine sediment metagenome TaxID=412755 RepID=A0A0F9IB96_9ZZZZ